MNENLSRIVADLFAKAKEGEDLSSGINRVRDEIKTVIESETTIFGKFHALAESFREVIPEEKQRYHAAIKALLTTSKLSRQEIVAAVNIQLNELKILEKLLIPALPGWRDELKAKEAKSQEMRNEISRLREKTAQLEKEEKEIANRMASQENEMERVEKAMREVFTDIGAEITSIKTHVEELTAESAVSQPVPDEDFAVRDFSAEKKKQMSNVGQSSSRPDIKSQKICPMCGGQMSFSMIGKMWQCYSCAYEELEKDEVQVKYGEKSEHTNSPEPTPASELKKKCPMCGGQMDFYISEGKWQCYSCGHEEEGKDEVQVNIGEKSERTIAPEPGPDSEQKKKCPMCGGQMDFYISEGKWQCYSCGFEYLEKDEAQGKREEKNKHSSKLEALPASEPIFDLSSVKRDSDGYRESTKESSPPAKKPSKNKPCPSCGKTMYWYESEKVWECRNCGYEKRI